MTRTHNKIKKKNLDSDRQSFIYMKYLASTRAAQVSNSWPCFGNSTY